MYQKVVGSIQGQGEYRKQPLFLFLPLLSLPDTLNLSFPPSLKIKNISLGEDFLKILIDQ